MSSPFLDLDGNSISPERIIGSGATAVVLLQDGVAVKTPLRYHWSSNSEVKANTQSLRREQDVYRHLKDTGDDHGVVHCIGFLANATQLAYMANGDLRAYLAKSRPPRPLQLRCVSSSLDSDMQAIDANGYTTRMDIALLATVMYEIITGVKCDVDLYMNNSPTDGRAYWPERKLLPSTDGIWLGWVIDGCWNGEIATGHDLLQALDSLDPRPHIGKQTCERTTKDPYSL
ncbi:hypothetical protein BJY00DRAFT_299932 [Aspergillus carlsbadensis]|nr:hypothetical protein BJY00DRAFT_299932 [Aspergillus carlsbadensis]